MPIFHNPNCLYADSIRYCLCEIYSCIYLVYELLTDGSVNYSIIIVRVLYIQPKVHCTCSYRHIQPWLHISSDCTCTCAVQQ